MTSEQRRIAKARKEIRRILDDVATHIALESHFLGDPLDGVPDGLVRLRKALRVLGDNLGQRPMPLKVKR